MVDSPCSSDAAGDATGGTAGVEFLQRVQHGNHISTRHARAYAAANRENDPLASGSLEHFERSILHFLGSAADGDFQRVYVAHEAHTAAHPPLHLGDVLLLAPVQHVEPRVRKMVQAGIDFGVVVVELDPVFRKSVAYAFEVGMRVLQVVFLVDESHDVVEDENAFHRVAHRLVLGLEPVDNDPGTQVDQLVGSLRILYQVDHEVGGAADKPGSA